MIILFEFKLSIVESYLSGEASYRELALENGINNASLIYRWVLDFRAAGPEALRGLIWNVMKKEII